MVHPVSSPLANVPTTPVLDVQGALALIGDMEDLYLQIAQAYHGELSALPQRIESLLQPHSSPDEARRYLHTFKGLSMTVGANALADACREAEARIKHSQDQGATLDAGAWAGLRSGLAACGERTLAALSDVLQGRAGA
jgi:HPt (histidine-containing phosphotransfer) domain-containing protein